MPISFPKRKTAANPLRRRHVAVFSAAEHSARTGGYAVTRLTDLLQGKAA